MNGTLVYMKNISAGQEIDYIRAAGMTVARVDYYASIRYQHKGHLGSASFATNATGEIWSEQYTPFSETMLNPPENDDQPGFTGHIKDKSTGLNYMQARYYDPVVGRFLSIDPVTFMGSGNPAQFNRYAYSFNDPINMIDPDGENPVVTVAIGVLVKKAGTGAIKGAGIAAGASAAVQSVDGGNVRAIPTIVVGVKGGLVGATHEVTGSGKLTSGVAGAAGAVDRFFTHITEGGDLVGAIGQASIIGGIDYGATGLAMQITPGKKADLAAAAIAIGGETAAAKGPEMAKTIFNMSQDAGQKIIDGAGDIGREAKEQLDNFIDDRTPTYDPF